MRRPSSPLVLLCCGSAVLAADPVADRQASIGARTLTVADELDGAVADFRDNGLGDGEDVRTLTAVRQVLGKLSADDMRQVADLLRRAHGTDVATAYAGQQDIVARLRSLLVRYQRQQRAAELAATLDKLADRQDANLHATVQQARAAAKGDKQRTADQRGRPAGGPGRAEAAPRRRRHVDGRPQGPGGRPATRRSA